MALIAPRRGGGLYEPVADINVTPLVDVMLVLLIIFMITAPMLAAGMRVDLPKASTARPLDPKEPIIVTVTKDGATFLGHDEVARADLAAAVEAKLGGDFDRIIHVRGDRELMYGEIVAVMDQLAAKGFTRIALVANARSQAPGSAPEPAAGPR
jgi:biopolymer transport protein ExbD